MVASSQKGEEMDEVGASEILKELAEENQTRKILEIVKESESLEEAQKKIESLLEK